MANLTEIAQEWAEGSAVKLAEELTTGPHVHVISGDLKASFAADGNTVTSNVPYATTELNRPGNRRVSPFTPHTAMEMAWDAVEDDAIDFLAELLQEQLDIPNIIKVELGL